MSKPRILICLVCGCERGSWVNPKLCLSLLRLARGPRFDIEVTVSDAPHIHVARNTCMVKARESNVDFLIQLDSDITLPEHFADVLSDVISRNLDVVGLGYALFGAVAKDKWAICPPISAGIFGNEYREVGSVPAGILIIRSAVWQQVPGPWFKYEWKADEIASRQMDEDMYFCELAGKFGFKVWTHNDVAGHLKTVDMSGVITGAVSVQNLSDEISQIRAQRTPGRKVWTAADQAALDAVKARQSSQKPGMAGTLLQKIGIR